MRIVAISSSYYERGAAPITDVGRHIQRFLASVSPSDLTIEIESFHLSTEPTRPSLGPLRDRFESNYLRLPRIRHLRKTNRIILEYPSNLPSSVALAHGKIHPQTFRAILGELRQAIEFAFSSNRSLTEMLDTAALRGALAQATNELAQTTDGAIEQLIDEIGSERQAEHLIPMTMERLPIDWSQFHATARSLLEDPFFWDIVDDDAPQGNDTGADLLVAFQSWREDNRETDPLLFLDAILKQWGLSHDRPTILQAEIGLAFAQIKIEGRCDSGVTERALRAIDHRLSDLVHDAARTAKFRYLRERLAEVANRDRAE